MFLRVTTILLVSLKCLLAAESSTTEPSLQFLVLSTSFGNTTTRETETTEVQIASNLATENVLVTSDISQLHQEPKNIEQTQNYNNFLKPRGKTKFIFENIVQASGNGEISPRNETTVQDQSNYYYSIDHQTDNLQQQQLQLATMEKEEFINSELDNLAKDIAETELNRETGKTINSNPRPATSWKSFFSNIFPQGIMNVFHLSVAAEPSQKSREFSTVQVNRIVNPNEGYQNKRVITDSSTLSAITRPIDPVMPISPPLPIAPSLSETPSPIPIIEETTIAPEMSITPKTIANEEHKNGTVMTNKDVFDINSAAEVSELPFEAVIPMESRNVFHIHPLNCENNCGDESEDYIDQISETGDDNVVAFSREAPTNIFYPTLRPSSSYDGTDTYYSGTGTQTSEEIIRENTKDFGQKMIPYHPAKQLDDFQKEVEKQFDHNEVRIDTEAASRKFLKHFKGKYVKPQQSETGVQFPGQSSTFKGINHFELIGSTLRPEVNFQSQPNPMKPESKLHTYIYSAGFKTDSESPKVENSGHLTEQQQRKSKGNDPNNSQDHLLVENPPNSNNLNLPYPNIKPGTILRSYIFSSDNSNNSVVNAVSETPNLGSSIPPWSAPNKNSDTKESTVIIPNQVNSGNRLYTNIYSAGLSEDSDYNKQFENQKNGKNDNINNDQGQINDDTTEELYGAYSTNLKPESLLHTYVYSAHDKNNNTNSGGPGEQTPKSDGLFSPWVTPKSEIYQSQGLSSFKTTSQKTYLCSSDQLKNGDCPYSTTPSPDNVIQQGNIFEVQKSLEQQVKHTKPYVYYNYPPGQPMLSMNPIRVAQPEDSQQSASLFIPESYQQRQQYLQDQQKQLNQQQDYFQLQQIQQYQQKLQYQQLQEYQQKQREQMQKQQEQLQQYQQKQQQQLQQYQQVQQQQRNQQQLQLYKQQLQHQQQVQQYKQMQQQQQDQQQMQKQQQQLQQYQKEQQTQRGQQQLIQMQNQQKDQQQKEHQQHYEKQQKHILKVEKIIPKPYPVPVKEIVEKIVERPVHVEHIVEKPVEVPYPVREVVEKFVDRPYPVEKIVDRPVHIPYPVQVDHFIDRPYAVRVPVPVAVPVPVHQYIDRPYPVEKIVEKPIQVPYPVEKIVEKIVEKHIPVEVERIVEVEKPAPKKPKKTKAEIYATQTIKEARKNKHKAELEELLQLVPPPEPADQNDHAAYKTIPDDVEFILLDDYNGPVPLDHQQAQGGYEGFKPEKRATKNHNIKRSPEFRRNLRVEYGFRPPLIPSVEIGEKGII